MTAHGSVLTSVASAVLVVSATDGVAWSFRISTAVLVAALIGAGQRWDLSPATAAGLLGLVVIIGAGPASSASPIGLLAWAVPAWAVVLAAAAATDRPPPPPRDGRTRWRLAAAQVAAVAAAVPLVVVAASGATVPPVWAAAGGFVVVALLAVALERRSRTAGRDQLQRGRGEGR